MKKKDTSYMHTFDIDMIYWRISNISIDAKSHSADYKIRHVFFMSRDNKDCKLKNQTASFKMSD